MIVLVVSCTGTSWRSEGLIAAHHNDIRHLAYDFFADPGHSAHYKPQGLIENSDRDMAYDQLHVMSAIMMTRAVLHFMVAR